MSTKKETPIIDDPCAELRAEIETLTAKLDAATLEIETLKSQASQGRAGYIVSTPNPQYTGATAGIHFRRGKAFIPAGEEGEKLARFIAAEFDYKVEYVEDYQAQPEGEQIKKSMIDSLIIPQRR